MLSELNSIVRTWDPTVGGPRPPGTELLYVGQSFHPRSVGREPGSDNSCGLKGVMGTGHVPDTCTTEVACETAVSSVVTTS